MACGCPVITTPLSSLPEVAGDAALYVDPDDAESLRQAFDAVREPERRGAMIAAGTTRAKALTWDAAAAAFASVLTAAAQTAEPDERAARDAVWGPLRRGQAHEEATSSGGRRRPERGPRPTRVGSLSKRVETLALFYLPPRAAARLRAVKASIRRVLRTRVAG
jgi:hypothetical protein